MRAARVSAEARSARPRPTPPTSQRRGHTLSLPSGAWRALFRPVLETRSNRGSASLCLTVLIHVPAKVFVAHHPLLLRKFGVPMRNSELN
jgi:hypothetical protein